MDKSNPDRISYSKCVIKKVIRPIEWASLATTKEFTVNYIPKGYTYHDYRMAWYRAFLLRPFDHSWFFTFHSNCQEEFPIWFYEWWHSYGPTTDILPPAVLKGRHQDVVDRKLLCCGERSPFCWSNHLFNNALGVRDLLWIAFIHGMVEFD